MRKKKQFRCYAPNLEHGIQISAASVRGAKTKMTRRGFKKSRCNPVVRGREVTEGAEWEEEKARKSYGLLYPG